MSVEPHDLGFDPPSSGRGGTWLRFLLAGFLVVALVAAATATAGLLEVKSIIGHIGGKIGGLAPNTITPAQAGHAQTFLLIGSDHRAKAGKNDARSDTMMLMRVDPNASAITVLSIPRDLKVSFQIPGGGYRSVAKINETYTDGGDALTAQTIKSLLNIPINHIVNIDFRGFKSVVDAIGCVYADVDRRYYHSNVGLPPSQQYSEINISAGYQRLCGEQALEFVRFRHTDSDFVRAARQQDFLRQIKSQYGIGKLAADPGKLVDALGKYVKTDPGLQTTGAFLQVGELLAFSAGKPIREIHFPPVYDNVPGGASYVLATPATYALMRHEFLSPPPPVPKARERGHGHRGGGPANPAALGLVNAAATGESYAIRLGGGVGLPIFYPKLLTSRSSYVTPLPGENPRAYRILGPDKKHYAAYRLVVSDGNDGNNYGVQGTTWKDPPILRNPSETRVVNRKRLDLFFDGQKLRLVAWRTSRAVYWISNTLQEDLTNKQILAIAGSLTRLGGH